MASPPFARPPLILASASPFAGACWKLPGVAFRVVPADVDEACIETQAWQPASAQTCPAAVADALARAKAEAVSAAS